MSKFTNIIGLLVLLLSVSCVSQKNIEEQVLKVMKEKPEILTEAIKANPVKFMEAIQAAANNARGAMAKKRANKEKQKLEKSYNNPLKPNIRKDESIRGPKDAPITLVEYSDFQCPYCSKAYKETVIPLLEKYKGKIKFIYKHLPLSFHKFALPAAKYYEAIRLQSATKAFAFHDELYKNQSKLSNGKGFLNAVAKKLGVDMKKLEKDINSSFVKNRIAEDQKEAQGYGMQGTPGFLLNGVPVKGAYPLSYFDGIIEKLKSMGKLKL